MDMTDKDKVKIILKAMEKVNLELRSGKLSIYIEDLKRILDIK